MNRAIPLLFASLLLSIPGFDARAEAEVEADKAPLRTSKVQSPIQVDYRVIGTPVVGSPVAVELRLQSRLGTQPYRLSYRVNDATAMQLPEAQSESVLISPSASEELSSAQVTVIPLREGRLYLNVAAEVDTGNGSMQTVIAVPIQVGTPAPRTIVENGTVSTDADGNLLRSLPAKED